MKNCIFLIADSKFYHQILICLKSIVRNYPNHPDIIICPMDMSAKQKASLSSICACIFINSDLSFSDVWPLMTGISYKVVNPLAFWSRFLIWKSPLFSSYDSVLYLDSDTVVIKPLDPIFDYDFYIEKDLYRGDYGIFLDIYDHQLKYLLLQDKIMLPKTIANAGVFCISRELRGLDEFNELMKIKDTYQCFLSYADQSVLNLWLLKKDIKIFSKNVYNFQYYPCFRKDYLADILEARIIHFNGLNLSDRIILMHFHCLLGNRLGVIIHILIYCPLFLKSFILKIVKYIYKILKKHFHA